MRLKTNHTTDKSKTSTRRRPEKICAVPKKQASNAKHSRNEDRFQSPKETVANEGQCKTAIEI